MPGPSTKRCRVGRPPGRRSLAESVTPALRTDVPLRRRLLRFPVGSAAARRDTGRWRPRLKVASISAWTWSVAPRPSRRSTSRSSVAAPPAWPLRWSWAGCGAGSCCWTPTTRPTASAKPCMGSSATTARPPLTYAGPDRNSFGPTRASPLAWPRSKGAPYVLGVQRRGRRHDERGSSPVTGHRDALRTAADRGRRGSLGPWRVPLPLLSRLGGPGSNRSPSYGAGAAHLALILASLSDDIVLLTDGSSDLEPDEAEHLRKKGRDPRGSGSRARVRGRKTGAGRLRRRLDRRSDRALLRPEFTPSSLPAQLGCELDDSGAVVIDGEGRTSVPGVYAAGDATPDKKSVVLAAAAGSRAADSINVGLASGTRTTKP